MGAGPVVPPLFKKRSIKGENEYDKPIEQYQQCFRKDLCRPCGLWENLYLRRRPNRRSVGAEAFVEEGRTEVLDYSGKGLVMPSCGNGHAHYEIIF